MRSQLLVNICSSVKLDRRNDNLSISSIHRLPSISGDFVLAFPQSYIDMDVFIGIPLGMEVDGNRGKWVISLNKSLYVLNQLSTNWFDLLKTILESRGYRESQIYPC